VAYQIGTDASSVQLRLFSLARLDRFAVRARGADALPPWQRRLVRHAAFSAYRDCVALGLADEARQVIAGDVPPAPQLLAHG